MFLWIKADRELSLLPGVLDQSCSREKSSLSPLVVSELFLFFLPKGGHREILSLLDNVSWLANYQLPFPVSQFFFYSSFFLRNRGQKVQFSSPLSALCWTESSGDAREGTSSGEEGRRERERERKKPSSSSQ